MINQNQYGKIQKCSKCSKPLEKARTQHVARAVCQVCQKKRSMEMYWSKKFSAQQQTKPL